MTTFAVAFGAITATVNICAALGLLYPPRPWQRAFHAFGALYGILIMIP